MLPLNLAVVASICAFLIGSASVASDVVPGSELATLHSSFGCAPRRSHDTLDPPDGYASLGVAKINGIRLAIYALRNGARLDDAAGEGRGFADVYDGAGHLIRRFSFRDNLNSPPLVVEYVSIPAR
jgi:hypothetical protein